MIAKEVVFWQSNTQSAVAISAIEAEYATLFDATKELIWIESFIKRVEMQSEKGGANIFFNDNYGAI